MEYVLTLSGQVPTKKNNLMILRHGRHVSIGHCQKYREWETRAAYELKIQRLEQGFDTVLGPVCLSAKVTWLWSGRGNTPDLTNIVQSIEDALQLAGVVKNDRQIVSLDGTRLTVVRSGEPGVEMKIIETDEGGKPS